MKDELFKKMFIKEQNVLFKTTMDTIAKTPPDIWDVEKCKNMRSALRDENSLEEFESSLSMLRTVVKKCVTELINQTCAFCTVLCIDNDSLDKIQIDKNIHVGLSLAKATKTVRRIVKDGPENSDEVTNILEEMSTMKRVAIDSGYKMVERILTNYIRDLQIYTITSKGK